MGKYDSFRDSLKVNFEDRDIENRIQLKKLMRAAGYHTKKDGELLYPTQKQLDYAWNYLKGRQIIDSKGRIVKQIKSKPVKVKKPSKKEFVRIELKKGETIIKPKGFKKRQIRDSKGRIVKWID